MKEQLQHLNALLKINLTDKEVTVIRMLLLGLSAREIGEQIHRSKRTVEHHIERIKDKMDCSSKSELIQKGRELEKLGLLGEEEEITSTQKKGKEANVKRRASQKNDSE